MPCLALSSIVIAQSSNNLPSAVTPSGIGSFHSAFYEGRLWLSLSLKQAREDAVARIPKRCTILVIMGQPASRISGFRRAS